MFSNNNILAFLFSVLPALIYGFFIFAHAPKKSIHLSKLWIYTIIGFLSITFFHFFTFIFPDFQKPLFREFLGVAFLDNKIVNIFMDTPLSVFFFAFIQVALLEELCKWAAFKSGDLIRGKNTLRDHPYAIMFYTAMVAAGFAAIENTDYAIRTIRGSFGPDVNVMYVLSIRSITSVIMHMVCGIIMGYYIALGAKSLKSDRIKFNIIGLVSAMILHGIYDFCIMYEPLSEKTLSIGELTIHWPSMIIVLAGLTLAYFMATDLIYRKIKRPKFK